MPAPKYGDSFALRILLLLGLIALVVLLQTGLQTKQMLDERASLDRIKAGQNDAVGSRAFQKSDLEKVVQATLNLARDGDTNVLPVIEQLKTLGVVKEEAGDQKERHFLVVPDFFQ